MITRNTYPRKGGRGSRLAGGPGTTYHFLRRAAFQRLAYPLRLSLASWRGGQTRRRREPICSLRAERVLTLTEAVNAAQECPPEHSTDRFRHRPVVSPLCRTLRMRRITSRRAARGKAHAQHQRQPDRGERAREAWTARPGLHAGTLAIQGWASRENRHRRRTPTRFARTARFIAGSLRFGRV